MTQNEARRVARDFMSSAGLLIGSCSLALSIVLLSTRQSMMQHEIEHYVRDRTQKRWTSDDSLAWIAEFRRLNPSLRVPDMRDIRPDLADPSGEK